MPDFSGKTIIVTGGGSGIGAATVRRLHEAGANVVAVDLHQADAQKTVDAIGGGDRLLALGADVSDAGQVKAMFESGHQALRPD